MLIWLPSPVSDWALIPNDASPEWQQLWHLLDRTLTSLRGELVNTPQECSLAIEDYSRPWAIIRLLPDARRYTVARFHNRQDADDHRRFLSRFIPAAKFEVLFDIPNEQLQHSTHPAEDYILSVKPTAKRDRSKESTFGNRVLCCQQQSRSTQLLDEAFKSI